MSTLRCFCRWGQKKDEKTSHVCTSRRPPRNWSEISKGSQASGQQSQKSAAAAEKAKSKWNCRAQLNSRFGLGFMLSFEPLPPHKSTREILRCESIWGCLRFLGCCVQATHHLPHFWRSWRASSIWFWFYFILASSRLFIYSSRFRLGVCLQSGGGRGESHARQAFSFSHRCLESLGVVTKRSGPLLLRIRIGYA